MIFHCHTSVLPAEIRSWRLAGRQVMLGKPNYRQRELQAVRCEPTWALVSSAAGSPSLAGTRMPTRTEHHGEPGPVRDPGPRCHPGPGATGSGGSTRPSS